MPGLRNPAIRVTWAIPDLWPFVLLALAAWRVFHLLAEDTILDRPRERFAPEESKRELFIRCPFCAGFWIAVGWYMFWWWEPKPTLAIASVFALSAVAPVLEALLSSRE